MRYPGAEGKRKDRFFTNETDALNFVKEQRKETGETGTNFGSMTEEERSALAFWRMFESATSPKPPELLTVLKDFKITWLASKSSVTVRRAIDDYIAHHEADGSSKRHIASLKSRLGRFEKSLGECLVSNITTSVYSEWLNGLRAMRADCEGEKLAIVTRQNFGRSLRSFFSFAIERGWTLANPIPAAKRSKSRAYKLASRPAPAIMLPSDIEKFMNAVKSEAPKLLPFWAFKFFAGIRDAEAAQMDWNMIDMKERLIHLPAQISKTGEARTVKIERTLLAWLQPYAKSSGKIAPDDSARKRGFKKVISTLAVRNPKGKVTKPFVFPSNAARHCFGSYHLFHFRNAGETALQLGHKGNPAMLHEHYKNPTAEKYAAAFWKIMPAKNPNNVTDIRKGRKSA